MDRLMEMQIFMRVVEMGSFSRAAREMKLTQPTVTKHINSMEGRLNARLLNRNQRAVSVTEIGARYYEKCKDVVRDYEEAQDVVLGRHTHVEGLIRVGTSLTFGRRIVSPLLVKFMQAHPNLRVDVNHDDRYVDLVALGLDVAIRLGSLADSSLGGRYLGLNPWVMVASPAYLTQYGEPKTHTDLSRHACLIYSSVQEDDYWRMRTPSGERVSVFLHGRLRSNNLSSLVTAARADMGITIVPHYVAAEAISTGAVRQIMADHVLPDQEIHAVYPSPKLVPVKVTELILFLKEAFQDEWWRNPTAFDQTPAPESVTASPINA
ncbi:LysR family transcriptional regulator [Paraburkholderia sp. 1N]|uniref:LysR family transcriptional regulator n=1 Tax=Paraburkholderia solitsugae TaxID=2675748 RepID=A0ABX2BP74_9BURK|nr:LysR family transcriptional regulator [Paraburkholderia solitsugae]NPT42479.1 LysR family transcriptional regulator [Paraburkholderia solitsugae]